MNAIFDLNFLMNKLTLLALVLMTSSCCYSQIKYENGYFIDNKGNKITCLIKNEDWNNNPREFNYKLDINSKPESGKISDVAEFSITNSVKYIRFTVDIDRSSDNINELSTNPRPEFKEEQLFLKPLLEGKATLYSYEGGNLLRFFYRLDSSTAEQLIHKSYVDNSSILKNDEFRNQLLTKLSCPTIFYADIQKVEYEAKDMIKFFTQYNQCHNSESLVYKRQTKKGDQFNLSLRPGVSVSGLSISNSSSTVDLENKTTIRFGIESEIVLPFNKNKWAIIIEPAFQYYKSQITSGSNKTIEADYKSIEFLAGIRYYFFINDQSKIFINGQVLYDVPFSSAINYESREALKISSHFNAAFGFGYKYKNKFSLEARYKLSPDLLGEYTFWGADYKTFSVILGYTIF